MKHALSFLGGAGTVTGSKYLLEASGCRVLVDCGLFQGFKQLRLRNWAPLPVDPKSIDAVVLTHAHLDHSGYLPVLIRDGFRGPVYCTEATQDLCHILLPDSGFLQEKDADFANRHGFSKHQPAKPLYTLKEADASLKQFRPVLFGQALEIHHGVGVRFNPAGHILGAAIVEFDCAGTKLVFSGDLGRFDSATMLDPTFIRSAGHLVVESTYGDRGHDKRDPEDLLAEVIGATVGRGGSVVIPAFAVGRTQTLLFHLYRLKSAKRIPDVPIVMDSPMAINASELLCKHLGSHKMNAAECRAACAVARYVRDVEESKALGASAMPMVIISASGMATGGRVLHHLKRFAPDPKSTILFTGFQAGGTRGAAMLAGADRVKIHGDHVPVRASVANLPMLSAHADSDEVLRWLHGFENPPANTFVTHGEPAASDALRHRIEEELGWACQVPEYRDRVELA